MSNEGDNDSDLILHRIKYDVPTGHKHNGTLKSGTRKVVQDVSRGCYDDDFTCQYVINTAS